MRKRSAMDCSQNEVAVAARTTGRRPFAQMGQAPEPGMMLLRFGKRDFIDYNGGIEVHGSLLNDVVHDQPQIKAKCALFADGACGYDPRTS